MRSAGYISGFKKRGRYICGAAAVLLSSVILSLSFFMPVSSYASQAVRVIRQEIKVEGPGQDADNISIRTDNFDKEPQFGGGTVKFLSNDASARQQLCGIFESADGKVLVIDGGVPENAAKLKNALIEAGGTVDAWLITHPQDDHVGALSELLGSWQGDINIENIYYNFHDFSWYAETAPEEQGMVWNLMTQFNDMASMIPTVTLHGDIKKGDVITLSENLSFTVLNDPLKLDSVYAVNDSGVMYDVYFQGKHFFVPGDMGPDGGDILMRQGVLDGLVCDYCVMAHHGQNGLKEDFYRALSPGACIWSCPDWLFDAKYGNVNGFKTYETKRWVKNMKITDNYCTYGTDVVLK